jgi:hypothetical protein
LSNNHIDMAQGAGNLLVYATMSSGERAGTRNQRNGAN